MAMLFKNVLTKIIVLLFLLPNGFPQSAWAQLPTFMQPYADWLQLENPSINCTPVLIAGQVERKCDWTGTLMLDLQASGAHLQAQGELEMAGMVVLPGERGYWPNSVTSRLQNGRQNLAIVTTSKGAPAVSLSAGPYQLEGRYDWQKIPKSLNVPQQWALLQVTLPSGLTWKRSNGQLEFGKTEITQDNNSQSIQIYRHLLEAKPQVLTTRLELSITGVPRFLVIPGFQMPGSRQMSMNSNLPFTLLPNGNIQLQVRPGRYWLEQRARLASFTEFKYQQPAAVGLESSDLQWPAKEYWAFDAQHQAGFKVQTGELVDAAQVNMPTPWAHLPTYRISAAQALVLEAKPLQTPPHRADLKLSKAMWLSFDGREFISVDHIFGTLGNQWRLDVLPPNQLERATVNQQPMLITQSLGPDNRLLDGVEVRSPNLLLDTISRQPRVSKLSLTGWAIDFESVESRLHLPPGWSLFAAFGDRGTSDDWLNQWSLWSIFVVMIFIALAFRSMGFIGAGLAAMFGVLSYHMIPIVVVVLLGAFACIFALNQVRSEFEGFKKLLFVLLVTSGVWFLLLAIPYTIEMVRLIVYPQLEHTEIASAQPLSRQHKAALLSGVARSADGYEAAPEMLRNKYENQSVPSKAISRPRAPVPVENDFLQTGKSAPQWRWNEFKLVNRGVVTSADLLQVYLMNPWATRLWRLASVCFLWLLFLRLSLSSVSHYRDSHIKKSESGKSAQLGNTALMLGLVMIALSSSPDLAAQQVLYPPLTEGQLPVEPTDLLDDLRAYLNQPPACMPNCLGVSAAHLAIDDQILTWTLTVNAVTATALPLPSSQHWSPNQVNADFTASLSRTDQGQIYVKVPAGLTNLVISGAITGAELEFNLPVPLHNVTYTVPQWQTSQNQLPNALQGRLRLEKRPATEPVTDTVNDTVNSNSISKTNPTTNPKTTDNNFTANYVEIERQLLLGSRWLLTTRITRKAPATGVIELRYPLWAGEKPNQDLDIEAGVVKVRLVDQVMEWTSEIEPVERLALTSSAGDDYYETWQVKANPRWRFTAEGLAAEPQANPQSFISIWRPVAGDELVLYPVKPPAKAAPSQSVDQAKLVYQLGETTNKASLDLHILAASPGDYQLELDENAVIESVRLNDQARWSQGNRIEVPLIAGHHRLMIEWTVPAVSGLQQISPGVKSSLPLANLKMTMIPLKKTWIISLFGPELGPAVLFWGVLAVIIAGAFVLMRLQKKFETALQVTLPMQRMDWLLLGLGLSSVWSYSLLVIAFWLFVLGWRMQLQPDTIIRPLHFKLVQLAIVGLGVVVAALVVVLIPKGLLVKPQMFIMGNGSNSNVLQWFQDSTSGSVPEFGFVSLPTWAFHGLMLLWSFWFSQKALVWFQYAFKALQQGGHWRKTVSDEKTTKQQGGHWGKTVSDEKTTN